MLKKKCGSASEEWKFPRLVTTICKEDGLHGHLPDYALSLDGDKIHFVNRNTMKALPAPEVVPICVDSDLLFLPSMQSQILRAKGLILRAKF